MFYCYVLRSQKTGRRYVGSCKNLAERIRRHNAGDSKATKHGVPWILVHSEVFPIALKRHDANGITRLDVEETNLMKYNERSPRRQVGGSNPLAPITQPKLGFKNV